MRFQPVKCNIMQITRKRIKKINASYSLEGTVLENVEKIKYLGVTITNDLKWNTHVSNICTKANRTLGFLRRNLAACPLDVKESAYKGLVRPILEYGSSVWDPQSILLQDELEKVQKRSARFVTGNYVDYETGSMTGILKNLKWESLKKMRKDSRLIMLYKGLKGAASIPTNDLVPPIRRTRNHHSLAFQIPMAGTDIYKSSFFPQTIRDWNLVTDSLIKNLKWESLKKMRKDSRLIMLYKGLKGAASIPTNDLVPPIRRTRNHHSLAFQIPMAGTDIYKSSFFPQTIRDWNLVTDSLITASECAVDSVTKFTSLVRARD